MAIKKKKSITENISPMGTICSVDLYYHFKFVMRKNLPKCLINLKTKGEERLILYFSIYLTPFHIF